MNNKFEWYSLSYEAILRMARWDEYDLDVAKKFTSIFAWMPMMLLNVRHRGGKVKADEFSYENVVRGLQTARPCFEKVRSIGFENADFLDKGFQHEIWACTNHLVDCLGWVGASKYLHFSAPEFFIMWDKGIIDRHKYKRNTGGFCQLHHDSQLELKNSARRQEALDLVDNRQDRLLRGLDILHMMGR